MAILGADLKVAIFGGVMFLSKNVYFSMCYINQNVSLQQKIERNRDQQDVAQIKFGDLLQ